LGLLQVYGWFPSHHEGLVWVHHCYCSVASQAQVQQGCRGD